MKLERVESIAKALDDKDVPLHQVDIWCEELVLEIRRLRGWLGRLESAQTWDHIGFIWGKGLDGESWAPLAPKKGNEVAHG